MGVSVGSQWEWAEASHTRPWWAVAASNCGLAKAAIAICFGTVLDASLTTSCAAGVRKPEQDSNVTRLGLPTALGIAMDLSELLLPLWSTFAAVAGFLLRQLFLDWRAAKAKRRERDSFLLALLVEVQLNNEELKQVKDRFPSSGQLLSFLKSGPPSHGEAAAPGDNSRARLRALLTILLGHSSLRDLKEKFTSADELLQHVEAGPSSTRAAASAQAEATVGAGNKPAEGHARSFRPIIVHYYLDFVFKGQMQILADLPDQVIKAIIQYYGKLETVTELVETVELSSFGDVSVDSRLELLLSIRTHLIEAYQLGESIVSQTRLLIDPRRRV